MVRPFGCNLPADRVTQADILPPAIDPPPGRAAFAPADPLEDPALFAGILPRRIFAFVLDVGVLTGLGILYYFAVVLLGLLTLGFALPLLVTAGAFLPLAYHTLTIGGPRSATLGMRAFGLQVKVWNGGAPGYLQALLHTGVFYLSLGLTSGLILLWALFNNRRRCLHDILCGTVVVRRSI